MSSKKRPFSKNKLIFWPISKINKNICLICVGLAISIQTSWARSSCLHSNNSARARKSPDILNSSPKRNSWQSNNFSNYSMKIFLKLSSANKSKKLSTCSLNYISSSMIDLPSCCWNLKIRIILVLGYTNVEMSFMSRDRSSTSNIRSDLTTNNGKAVLIPYRVTG